MLYLDKVLMKGIFQMYKVREPRKLTIQRETLLPKEQPLESEKVKEQRKLTIRRETQLPKEQSLESEANNKPKAFPPAEQNAAEKLRALRKKAQVAVKGGNKFRWIKIGYAAEKDSRNPEQTPAREAMLYMCYPVADEKNSYSAPDWDKVTFRLEIYDYRPNTVVAHKLRKKIQDTPLPTISANRVETLATAYEFDANGQHSKGYGAMDLIGMTPSKSSEEQAKLIESSEIMDAIRRDFKFSLTCAEYTDSSDIHSENPDTKPVFALSLHGPMGKISKDYAVPHSNKLCHAEAKTKSFFRPSEPIDFLSVVKAYKDKFNKK